MDPRLCSIPQNVVAATDITAVVERGPPGARLPVAERSNYTIVVLVKNGRLLIVQTEDIPSSDEWRTMSYDDVMADCRAYEALLSQRLSVVASLLDTIEFEKSQFAILVSDAQQSRLVAQPLDDIPPLIAPLGWLPRVQESDLLVVQWLDDRVHCIWNDQQVDFFTTFAIPNRWRLQQMITITHLLEKSKIHITYEPLAIVLRGAEVSGLIMARVEGRLLEMRDRSLESSLHRFRVFLSHHLEQVYSTFTQLHESNIMFEIEPFMDCLLVHKGNLCLTQCVHCLVQYEPGDRERDRLEARSWRALDKLFDDLPQVDRSLVVDMNRCWRKPTLLNYVPNPEPLIFRIIYWTNTSAEKYQNAERKKKDRHSTKPHLKSDTNSFMRHKTANSLWKPAYHPYGTDKYTLLISSQPEIARRTSDKHNRRRASRVVVRGVSMASDYTLVDVDDDTTVIGDERWIS
ncbi:uncharacterized protein C8R40DRAFT_1173563 [Lentinula edodes]|uniref:uncharacterized protein n=1 Tax=Lentinula edodes TaxID=5353 RepID=UPI001E8D7BF8|nr:uncharacterized protein C8R40DRAFT_1173563 [Lentinula edodes]KAH7872471.1 hypothetical protein C8R40DRAFT_1173563 [Lentinula edodes]